MDKNAIKKYAVWARRELIERVAKKAQQYGIEEKNVLDVNADSIGGKLLTASEKKQRQALITQIEDKGYDQVMEEVAYTWFNRISALRFMEVNGYLPTHVRVFTDEANNFKPQILSEAIHLEMDGLEMDKVFILKESNQTDELYKYLLITQCNSLNTILPGMFQKISDYTELLLPDNLLREGSVIEQLITLIPEDNFNISSENGQVEIIGWLYQYYNDEKKNQVININKGTVKKEDVPAATQLFTTDWVVRYIVDNSLGRYWIERNPDSHLRNELQYFVMPKNGIMPLVNENVTPQELTVFDPCMGSGHFLIYSFEVLMKIYVEYGYSEREAAKEIVEYNIHGLDIDNRASQLAYFAVMMKARQYDRRFFSRGVEPHVYSIYESNHLDSFMLKEFINGDSNLMVAVDTLIKEMYNAKEYGTIIQLSKIDFAVIFKRFEELKNEQAISIFSNSIQTELLPFIQGAFELSQKYAIVVTNPPYLNKYDVQLKKYVTDNYKDYSGDLFSVFIYRNFLFCKKDGYTGFMTPFVWMFIKTYEKLRAYIIKHKAIISLIQMEYSAFEEATVPICSFILGNSKTSDGLYFKLSEFKGGMNVQKNMVLKAINGEDCDYLYEVSQKNFLKIPGMPIAYWVPNYNVFDFPRLGNGYESGGRNKTHNNIKYLRYWWEISDFKRWQPYANGGDYRKWYGNHYNVVDWSDVARKNYASHGGLYNPKFWGKEGVCWNLITSSKNGFRIKLANFHYSSGSPTIISHDRKKDLVTLGFLNTTIAASFIKMFNPTINTTVSDVLDLPLRCDDVDKVAQLSDKCITLSKEEWDLYETSWDFKKSPLCRDCSLVSESYIKWKNESKERFEQLKSNEIEINEYFISLYGLQKSFSSAIVDNDITIRIAEVQYDIKCLISYAVGCMFGRYSLDFDGLAFPGDVWNASKYRTFEADKDNIIPICDDEYFADDIVGRFMEFIEVVYGKDTLDENLKFITDAIGGNGQPKEVIRNYFLNDFFNDHCKMYHKCPIYWQFDSGKKNGFKCLIYIHRYQPDTIMRIRTDYIHEQQSRYRTAIFDLEQRVNNTTTSERVRLTKKLTTLQAQAVEIKEYEEKIHHLADQMIHIDLNDGVRENYTLFDDTLSKIK